MASKRLTPVLAAVGLGVVTGIYIFRDPVKQASQDLSTPPASGSYAAGKSGKDDTKNSVSASSSGEAVSGPQASLKYGGSSPVSHGQTTVAGSTEQARKSGSVDHSPKLRENPNEQDGSGGGGQGLAEMRERKMKGQGLPSPQGGDTKAQTVDVREADGEGGGIKKGRKWLGGW